MSSLSCTGYATSPISDDHIDAYVKSLRTGGDMTIKVEKMIYSPEADEICFGESMFHLTCFTRDYSFGVTMNIITLQETPLVIRLDINVTGLAVRDDMFRKVYGFTLALFQIMGITPQSYSESSVEYIDDSLICTAEHPCAICVADGVKGVVCTDEYPCEKCGGKKSPPPLRRNKKGITTPVDPGLTCTAEHPCAICVADGVKGVVCTDEYPCEKCGGKKSPPPLRRK